MNEWEGRARALKAFKLSSVMLRAMRDNPSIRLHDVERPSEETKKIAARIAKVRVPSDETWRVMVDILRERLR